MTMSKELVRAQHGNWILAGATIDLFARAVRLLADHAALWSCACDKAGDWVCSTQDDTPLRLVHTIANLLDPDGEHVEIFAGGELTFLLPDLLPRARDLADVFEMVPRR